MTDKTTWEDLATEFKRLGTTLRAQWFATEGREDQGIWLLRLEGPDTQEIRATFSLIAAKAVAKAGLIPRPLPKAHEYDPHWSQPDFVPYGLGEIGVDALDPCTRAWLDLLRKESTAFRSSEGQSWNNGVQSISPGGGIPDVAGASAVYWVLSKDSCKNGHRACK